MPVPPPTEPSSTGPSPRRASAVPACSGLDVEAVDVVQDAVPGLAHHRQAPVVLAGLGGGDERVANDADRVGVGETDRRRQQARVAHPFEPRQLAVAVDPVRAGEERLGRRQDDGDARADVVALDQRRVADPDPGDVRDRVRRPGWEPADLDPEVTGAGCTARAYPRLMTVYEPLPVGLPLRRMPRAMATSTKEAGASGWRSTGSSQPTPSTGTRRPRCSTPTRSSAARAGSPRAARSPSTPASTPAARRRTSSSSASRARRTGSGGATSTPRSRRSTSTGCARRSSRTSAAATSTSSTRSPAPTPSIGSPSASSRTTRTTRSSPGRCSSIRPRTSCASSSRRRSSCTRPGSRPTPPRTARAPARSSSCTRRARRC